MAVYVVIDHPSVHLEYEVKESFPATSYITIDNFNYQRMCGWIKGGDTFYKYKIVNGLEKLEDWLK